MYAPVNKNYRIIIYKKKKLQQVQEEVIKSFSLNVLLKNQTGLI